MKRRTKIFSIKLKKSKGLHITGFYIGSQSHSTVASYRSSKAIAQYGISFNEGKCSKETWLQCALSLFEDLENKEKIIKELKTLIR